VRNLFPFISKVIIWAQVFTFISCASRYRRPESFEEKMNRFEIQAQALNRVPQLKLLSEDFSRMPASAPGKGVLMAQGKKVERGPYNNRHLYFITLYEQWNSFRVFSGVGNPDIRICPQFHSTLLTYREKNKGPQRVGQGLNYQGQNLNLKQVTSNLALYPEFQLPVGDKENDPTVIEYLKSNNFNSQEKIIKWAQNGINTHTEKLEKELNALCEYGKTTNYYNFENLITHANKKHMGPQTKNMKILMKTTLFTNQVILSRLWKRKLQGGRSLASIKNPKAPILDVMNRMKVPWAKNYFKLVEGR
jgi:hypothetical protein